MIPNSQTDDRERSQAAGALQSPTEGYVILSGGRTDLPVKVRDYMERGWVPQGGIVSAGAKGAVQFYQALVHPCRLPLGQE